MDAVKQRDERRRQGKTRHPAVYCLLIGFFAGVIGGAVRWLWIALNFTKVPQAFLADPFVKRGQLDTIFWHCMGYVLFILMSIVAAYVYWALLGKLGGPWPGLLFGALWWGLLFFWLGPLTGAVPPLREIGLSSIVTECALYLIWGLFIGFSYAFEYHDEQAREPKQAGGGGGGDGEPQPA